MCSTTAGPFTAPRRLEPEPGPASQLLRLVIGFGGEAPEGSRHRLALGVVDEGRRAGPGKSRCSFRVDLEKDLAARFDRKAQAVGVDARAAEHALDLDRAEP